MARKAKAKRKLARATEDARGLSEIRAVLAKLTELVHAYQASQAPQARRRKPAVRKRTSARR